MKNIRVIIIIAILIVASLACGALSGGGSDSADPSNSNPGNNGGISSSESEFPMTADAYNEVNIGDGSILYYTKLPLEDVMKFYRDEYTSRGYAEREILTVVSDSTFSVVFDGDPSGKALVIQSVDLGDGSRTVSIRLEDV